MKLFDLTQNTWLFAQTKTVSSEISLSNHMITAVSFSPSEVRQYSKGHSYLEGLYLFGGLTPKNGKNIASNNLYVFKLSTFFNRKYAIHYHSCD